MLNETYPTVSVLIPMYNAKAFIEDCLISVVEQTYPATEIIVVDDGSTDGSYDIALKFQSEKCKLFRQENKGGCAARNLAFQMSSGQYIMYLDADDLMDRNKVEQQVGALLFNNDGNAVASAGWANFTVSIADADVHYRSVFKDYERPVDLLKDMWEKREMLSSSVWLVPRALVVKSGGWNENLLINQDGEFFCRILLLSSQVVFVDTKTYYRVGVPNSVSRSKGDRLKAVSLLESYLLYEMHVTNGNYLNHIRKGLALNYYSFIYIYYHLYPDLVKKAIRQAKLLGIKPESGLFGGAKFQRLSKLIGFYNVLRLRKLMYSQNS